MNYRKIKLLGLLAVISSKVLLASQDYSDFIESVVNDSSVQCRMALACKGAYEESFKAIKPMLERTKEWTDVEHHSGDGEGDGLLMGKFTPHWIAAKTVIVVAFTGTIDSQMCENDDSTALLLSGLTKRFPKKEWGSQDRVNKNCFEKFERNISSLRILFEKYASLPIIFCGHSRGGAISDIASLNWGQYKGYSNIGTITFGQIYVFTKSVSDYLDSVHYNTAKVQNSGDVGPWLRRSGLHSFAAIRAEFEDAIDAKTQESSLSSEALYKIKKVPQYSLSGKNELIDRSAAQVVSVTKNHSISTYLTELEKREKG